MSMAKAYATACTGVLTLKHQFQSPVVTVFALQRRRNLRNDIAGGTVSQAHRLSLIPVIVIKSPVIQLSSNLTALVGPLCGFVWPDRKRSKKSPKVVAYFPPIW